MCFFVFVFCWSRYSAGFAKDDYDVSISQNYALVTFKDVEDAQHALYSLMALANDHWVLDFEPLDVSDPPCLSIHLSFHTSCALVTLLVGVQEKSNFRILWQRYQTLSRQEKAAKLQLESVWEGCGSSDAVLPAYVKIQVRAVRVVT